MTVKPLYYIPIFLQKVGFIVFYILHRIFVKIEVKGRENLEGINKPIIIALNHTSELDVTATPLILGFFSGFYPIYYISMPKDKFKGFGWRNYIYGGIFFNILGGYSIHSGFRDYETSLETFINLLEDGQTVLIFPEGKRTPDGKPSQARGGLGFLVYETESVVVPVAVKSFYGMSWKKYFGMNTKVTLTILPPVFPDKIIKTEEPTVEDYRNGSKYVMDKITEVL